MAERRRIDKKKQNVGSFTRVEAEQLIRSAFEELDRERARRIELEAELKALQESAAATPPKKSDQNKSRRRSSKTSVQRQDVSLEVIPPKHYTALQQEVEGYRQIVNAMTQERPAIAEALKSSNDRRSAVQTGRPLPLQSPTLPLHVIRLLEIMPWEPKAQEYAFATEEIYEWQVYSPRHQKWCDTLHLLPSFFQALPTIKSTANKVQEYQPLDALREPGRDRSMLMFLASCENMGNGAGSTASSLTAPPDQSVLTNAGLTNIIDITKGFPLPRDGGTWQWVGGWRIEKRVIVFIGDGRDSRPQTLDCDEDGWSYAMDASDFLKENPEQHCFERPGMVEDKVTLEKSFLSGNKVVRHLIPLRTVRRRKWTRRRVLVDYPHASEQSRHFLKLLAQNASLTSAANKISDQLVETKMNLTDTQLKTHQNEEETKLKVARLEQEIKLKEDVIAKLKQKKVEKKKPSNPHTRKTTKTRPVEPRNKEVEKGAPKDCVQKMTEKTVEEDKPTVNDEPQKLLSQQGSDLRGLVTLWVSSNTSRVKVISNEHTTNSSDSENPASEGASTASASIREDDESSSEQQLENPDSLAVNSSDDCRNGCSRRSSTSSTSSQISFDWMKLGRDTIEKFKQLNPAKDSQDAQGGESTPRSTSPTQQSQSSIEVNADDSDSEGAAPVDSPDIA